MNRCNLSLLCVFLLLGAKCLSQKIFLVAGQSNAVGVGDSLASPSCLVGTAFEYSFTDNTLVPLKDPTGIKELGFEEATTGSCWPAFAKQYNAITNEHVIIVQAGKGGSSCNPDYLPHLRWDVDGELVHAAILKTHSALELINQPLLGIIWIQGEADAVYINDKLFSREKYKKSLLQSIGLFRTKFGDSLHFYIVQTGLASGLNSYGFEEIQAAQREIVLNNQFNFLIYPYTSSFFDYGLMGDYIHYSQEGYNILGRSCADAIYEIEKKGKLYSQVLTNAVFPNPTSSAVNVRFVNIPLARNARLSVIDTHGKNVKSFELELELKILESIELDLTGIKSGYYVLKIEIGQYVSFTRVGIR